MRDITLDTLRAEAIDRVQLSTNLPDLPDCSGAGLDPKSEIQKNFPVVSWLLNTSLTADVQSKLRGVNGHRLLHQDGEGKWVIEVPRGLWSLVPTASDTPECCWIAPDFNKCAGQLPVNLLCLKDCDSILDNFIERDLRFGENVPGLASANESIDEVKKRVAKLSMAFYTAYTATLGADNVYTNILKPFHGLKAIMDNPAVASIDGTNVLSAFDQAFCRFSVVGANVVYATNPITYQSILAEIELGQNQRYPNGWTRNGDEIKFHGMGFILDKNIPVDTENGTGQVWALDGSAVGLFLRTNLQPADSFIFVDGHKEETLANGCASTCTYYYNYGTALANNASKLAKIVDIPITTCSEVIGDLAGLINPQTLIPRA